MDSKMVGKRRKIAYCFFLKMPKLQFIGLWAHKRYFRASNDLMEGCTWNRRKYRLVVHLETVTFRSKMFGWLSLESAENIVFFRQVSQEAVYSRSEWRVGGDPPWGGGICARSALTNFFVRFFHPESRYSFFIPSSFALFYQFPSIFQIRIFFCEIFAKIRIFWLIFFFIFWF